MKTSHKLILLLLLVLLIQSSIAVSIAEAQEVQTITVQETEVDWKLVVIIIQLAVIIVGGVFVGRAIPASLVEQLLANLRTASRQTPSTLDDNAVTGLELAWEIFFKPRVQAMLPTMRNVADAAYKPAETKDLFDSGGVG